MSRPGGLPERPSPEDALLGAQIQAINRFPDQNPNPVMRISRDGRLGYANVASEPIRLALGVALGEILPEDVRERVWAKCHDRSQPAIEITHEHRTFSLLPVYVEEFDFINLYGTDITAERAIARFPDQNPNPVFRVDDDGRLVYANAASQPLIEACHLKVGELWPADVAQRVVAAADDPASELLELQAGVRTYALHPVRISEFGFINVYGTDITAQKVVAKFPGENPNPVLRTDRAGALLYANEASAHIVAALKLAIGRPLPRTLWQTLSDRLAAGVRVPLELQTGELTYEMLPVLVEEFDFINLYGTDVSAAREVIRAKGESERLLLSILPSPIADRLRAGEQVIADRFDDASLLIADIVGFTALSSDLAPSELVELLNDVFSVCDALLERHGLEKVKTIGDAYMVIGGVPTAIVDHVERMADFALDMVVATEALQAGRSRPISLRIGINCGPVVAGVIGTKRTIYDVWGDTVNVASRMELLAAPGRIHVSPIVHDRLADRFEFESRGEIEVKGKGRLATWYLLGRK